MILKFDMDYNLKSVILNESPHPLNTFNSQIFIKPLKIHKKGRTDYKEVYFSRNDSPGSRILFSSNKNLLIKNVHRNQCNKNDCFQKTE